MKKSMFDASRAVRRLLAFLSICAVPALCPGCRTEYGYTKNKNYVSHSPVGTAETIRNGPFCVLLAENGNITLQLHEKTVTTQKDFSGWKYTGRTEYYSEYSDYTEEEKKALFPIPYAPLPSATVWYCKSFTRGGLSGECFSYLGRDGFTKSAIRFPLTHNVWGNHVKRQEATAWIPVFGIGLGMLFLPPVCDFFYLIAAPITDGVMLMGSAAADCPMLAGCLAADGMSAAGQLFWPVFAVPCKYAGGRSGGWMKSWKLKEHGPSVPYYMAYMPFINLFCPQITPPYLATAKIKTQIIPLKKDVLLSGKIVTRTVKDEKALSGKKITADAELDGKKLGVLTLCTDTNGCADARTPLRALLPGIPGADSRIRLNIHCGEQKWTKEIPANALFTADELRDIHAEGNASLNIRTRCLAKARLKKAFPQMALSLDAEIRKLVLPQD